MMPRKKRITLAIIIPLIIVLIIAITWMVLYLNTDMFKSNQTLFLKYMGKNVDNAKAVEKIFKNTEYEDLLQNNKYVENSEIKINYTKNLETTSEDTNNSINKLKLTIEGQVDKTSKYDYKNLKLLNDDKQTLAIEYIQNNNVYGIRFSDLFKQYILVENNNLKDLLKKVGYSDQQLENLPDSIAIHKDELNNIQFSEEELQSLKEKYLNIIIQNLSKENFEKQSDQIISINQKDVTTNAYILRLTNEQLNNIYIEVLENLKQDETILGKVENMQNMIDKVSIDSSNNVNLKEDVIGKMEEMISEISKNNIGSDETRIIVYENKGETVRTTIQGIDYEINMDYLQMGEENFTELTLKENELEVQKFTLKNNKDEIAFSMENNKDDKPLKITFEQNKKVVEDKRCVKNIRIQYEKEKNRIEASVVQNINVVGNFEEQIIFDNQNSIQLNDMEEEKLKVVLSRVSEGVQQKIDSISQEIRIEDIQEVLQALGIIQDKQKLEATGVSETEKNRFNSKFEILEGENIDSENMLKVIEVLKENLINLEAVSNEELKIEIDKNNKNEELGNTLENFIQKDKNRKYNVKIEYDEETGLVKYVVMVILKES